MGRNQTLGLSLLCGILLILGALTTFYFLYFPVFSAKKTHEIADAWVYDTPVDIINSSAAGYQLFLFPFNEKQKKIIRESRISYEEGIKSHF